MPIVEQIAIALDRQDYQTAAGLIKQLLKQEPHNPWGQLYSGRFYEETGKLDLAEKVYRHLLRQSDNPKIIAQARTSLQRIEQREQQRRREALAQATLNPTNPEAGILLIEPVTGEIRQRVVPKYAQILNLDLYSAQRQLPTRYWRLLRMGSMSELQVYGQELRNAGIPAFWIALAEINKIQVFQVLYIQELFPTVTILCQNGNNQMGSLTFDWSEVAQRVEGRLPIFESVVDFDARGRQQREERTQDYAQVYDLHLPGRNCLLRLCDSTYDFQQGVAVTSPDSLSGQFSNRINWNNLIKLLNSYLTKTRLWSDFAPFADRVLEEAEMVVDPTELLGGIRPHIPLSRREETNWDSAFQLYSGLVFLRNRREL